MNVKVKMKAQVNIFKDYEVEWGHFAVDLVNKKIPLKNLVERDFGPNLDGVGALHDLSFIEKEKLNQGLQMVKEYLIRISRLVKQGENFEDIKKTLEQNSVQLTPIGVSTLKNHTPVVPKFIPLLKIKKEILDKYNIKEEHLLEEAVELIQNNTHRLIYKYTYGIGIKRLLKEKILDLLDIDEMEYKQALLQVQQELSSLIEEALKNREALTEYNQIRSESKQPVKKKASSRKGKESVKPVEKIDNSKGQVVENEESHAVENNQEETSEKKERGDCVKKDNFLDYFTSIDTSDLEKEKIYHTISYFIENYVQKNDKGYQVAQSLYGKTLMEKISVSNMSMEERNNFFYFISTVKNYVKTGKIKRRPIHFIAYFISPNMSEEMRNKTKEQVDEILKEINKENIYYKIGLKLYGEDLKELQENVKLSQPETVSFNSFIQVIKIKLQSIENNNLNFRKNKFIDETASPNRYVNGKEVDSASLLSAIQNLEFLENKEEVIELVLTDYPMYFNQLLHSAYFHILFDILTKQEGELVYLKLLQRVGVKFTDEEISKITGLTLEEISTYQIMTKEDTLNQINQYIKRK